MPLSEIPTPTGGARRRDCRNSDRSVGSTHIAQRASERLAGTWRAPRDGAERQRAFNGKAKVDARFLAELERVLLSVPTEFGWQRPTWR